MGINEFQKYNIELTEDNYPEVVEYYAQFIRTYLNRIVEGAIWFDEL
jgi:hypothetical protein